MTIGLVPSPRTRLPNAPHTPAETRGRQWVGWVAAVAPAMILLVLGGIELSRRPALWYDEAYTTLAVRTPLPTLLSSVWHTTGLVSWLTVAPSFNAPYYVLMHGWAAIFGSSALSLRIPSLLFACLTVVVVGRIARRLAGDRAALLAGALVATGPLFVQQAVQARPYGMAELAIALVGLALVRRQQEGGRRRPLAGATCAAGLLHWFAVPVVIGLALGGLALRRRRAVGDVLVMAAALIPYAFLVAIQALGSGDGAPVAVGVGLDLPVHAVADWSAGAWWLSAALVAAFALGLARRGHRSYLVGWVLVPLLIMTALDIAKPMYFGRYMLFTLLGLALGAAVGVTRLPPRWRNLVAVALVGASLAACLPRLQTTALERPDSVIALLESQQLAGQPVAAGDGRAAVELVEEIAAEHSRIGTDLLLRPAHIANTGSHTVVWVVRSGSGASAQPSPNDAYLAMGRWSLSRTVVIPGHYGSFTVQEWTR